MKKEKNIEVINEYNDSVFLTDGVSIDEIKKREDTINVNLPDSYQMNLNAFGQATEESIGELEELLGFLLPEDYKKFLVEYNGGTSKVRYSKFFVEELNQEIPLDVLYGIGVTRTFDLIKCYEEFEEDMLPYSLVIGDDPGSGLIVLITDTEKHGVYYWDHSLSFPQSCEEENTYKVAHSFKGFLDELIHPR